MINKAITRTQSRVTSQLGRLHEVLGHLSNRLLELGPLSTQRYQSMLCCRNSPRNTDVLSKPPKNP